MKTIPLNRGFHAIIDDSDYDLTVQFRWYVNEYRPGIYRAMKNATLKCSVLYMHRLIMKAQKGQLVDHRDRNGLNNQRYNLRVCTHSQNLCNQGVNASNTAGFKGVYWHKGDHTWFSGIKHFGKKEFLGYFDSPKDAAIAYDEAIIRLRGEFAVTNKSLGLFDTVPPFPKSLIPAGNH